MTKGEKLIMARLLSRASGIFGNFGCNDFTIDGSEMTPEQASALDLSMHEWNGDPEEHEPGCNHSHQSDFFLMAYFAAMLEKEANDGERTDCEGCPRE